MEVRFDNLKLEKLFVTPLSEIKGKQAFPVEVIKQFKRRIPLLMAITKLDELRALKGLNFEYLKGDRKGECSIRLNDQYRLIFEPISENEIRVILVTEISKHYE
ncbi:MAG: type II toxin-antitoxin system RelE/ParE family toxin [Bacteroidetes bacterium]|nr:type II toxin-antitoxin system RelE/ParE family toxin [Bacteroidota bacterium]